MIDLRKEGFVAVQNNKIPLKNYLFYLTYNNRATTENHMNDVDLTSKNIYEASKLYSYKRAKETAKMVNADKGEILLSFSPQLCAKVVAYKYNSNLKRFKEDFTNKCVEILDRNMEQKEYSIFVHEYDSRQMRVHAHVLFYPYIEPVGVIKVSNNPETLIRPAKIWIEPEKLEQIKKEFNQYARDLHRGLEDKAPIEIIKNENFDTDSLFKLIKLANLKPNGHSKDKLVDLWNNTEINRLKKIIKLLMETSDDNKIESKKDFSIVIDYLYDFEDKEVYELFFTHKAIWSILKTFSVHKSNPKFSTVFLKLIHLTKDDNILELIKSKTKSRKAADLLNILKESFMQGDDNIQLRERDRKQGMSK